VKISELSRQSSLPVATVKYYLRQGLLPAGMPTAATQAQYDDRHLRRLKLIRALTEVAGLRLDAVRAVLDAVDDPDRSWHEAVGAAHTRLSVTSRRPASEAAAARAGALIDRRGWTLHPGGSHVDALTRALDALSELGLCPSDELLNLYASAAESIAEHEVASVPENDRESAAERVVIGTLLLEPVLLSIRRMAQEATSYRTRR